MTFEVTVTNSSRLTSKSLHLPALPLNNLNLCILLSPWRPHHLTARSFAWSALCYIKALWLSGPERSISSLLILLPAVGESVVRPWPMGKFTTLAVFQTPFRHSFWFKFPLIGPSPRCMWWPRPLLHVPRSIVCTIFVRGSHPVCRKVTCNRLIRRVWWTWKVLHMSNSTCRISSAETIKHLVLCVLPVKELDFAYHSFAYISSTRVGILHWNLISNVRKIHLLVVCSSQGNHGELEGTDCDR